MGRHKFIASQGGKYHTTIFCEWCGFIRNYANDSGDDRRKRDADWEKNKNCPNTPKPKKEKL